MTLKKENSIILGTFVALLVLLLGINLFALPRNMPSAVSESMQPVTMPAGSPADEKKNPGTPPPDFQARQESAASRWGRDPFISSWLGEETGVVAAAAPGTSGEELTVTLILISETKKIAAINHKICQAGDIIGDEKIVGIKQDGVVLEKNGTQRLLPLPKSVINF